MEPVAVLRTIIGLYNFSIKAYDYLQDVKSAPSDRRKYMLEATSLSILFLDLRDELEAGIYTPSWFSAARRLAEENGPFAQLKAALELIVDKLVAKGMKKIGQVLVWNYIKDEISKAFATIERIKSTISLTLTQNHSKVLQVVQGEVLAIRQDTSAIRKDLSSQQVFEVLEWLSPMNFAIQLNDNWKRYQASTGTWFLQGPQFTQWVKTPGTTLLFPGNPGTGKTIMSTLVVNHLLDTVDSFDTAVTYIFFNAKRREQQSSLAAASSLRRLKVLREEHKWRQATLDQSAIVEEFQILCSELRNVYIIVDGLDESYDSIVSGLVLEVNGLIATNGTHVHFMATSRHLPNIRERFQDVPTIDIKATHQDIKTYLMAQVPHMSSCVSVHESLPKEIVRDVAEMAKGVFLLARLHLDALKAKRTVKAVRLALQSLHSPPSVQRSTGSTAAAYDLAYEATMERIMAQHTDDSSLAIRVLTWVAFSPSYLTITELQHAMAVEHGSVAFDQDNIIDTDELPSICAGLVIIRSDRDGDQKAELARHTAQEYFERTCQQWMPDPHHSLAQTCVKYLSFDTFSSASDEYWLRQFAIRKFDSDNLGTAFPFYNHASCYWAFHIRNVKNLNSVDEKEGFMARFLSAPYAVKHAGLIPRATSYDVLPTHAIETYTAVSGLDLAVILGLVNLTRLLVGDGGIDELERIEKGMRKKAGPVKILSAALRMAIYYDHAEIFSMLLTLANRHSDEATIPAHWL